STGGMRSPPSWPAFTRIWFNVSPPIVVLTPNLSGSDGVSRLARLVTSTFGGARVRGGDGRSSRFVAAAVRVAASCDSRTTVIAIHLHLAPAALAFAA